MKLKKYIRILYKSNSGRVVLVLLMFLILFSIGSLAYFKSAGDEVRAVFLRDNVWAQKLLPLYWQARKLSDILYLPYYFKSDRVPTYRLEISKKNIEKLNDHLPDAFSEVFLADKYYVPAEFYFDGEKYEVEVRYRGDNAVHWNAPKRSYLIKFDKDKLFDGYGRLSFIIPNDRHFILEHLHNYRAGKLGLLHPPSEYANLKINGKNNGLYLVMENWSKEMLVKWQVPDESNFFSPRDQNEPAPAMGGFWGDISFWKFQVKDSQYNFDHFSEASALIELYNNPDDQYFFSHIFDLIDKDNYYAWHVHQELIGSAHQAGANVRIFFDDSVGKFFFIPWDIGNGYQITDNLNFYDPLAKRIFSNPQFAFEKNKMLYDYVSDKKNIKDDIAFYDDVWQKIKISLYKDRMKIYSNYWMDKQILKYKKIIESQATAITKLFDNNLITVNLGLYGNRDKLINNKNILAEIEINVEQIAELALDEIKLKGINENDLEIFYDSNQNKEFDIDDTMLNEWSDIMIYTNRDLNAETAMNNLLPTKHRFFVTSSFMSAADFLADLKKAKFEFINIIKNKKVNDDDIEIRISDLSLFDNLAAISDVSIFEKNYKMFYVDKKKNEIILPAGVYVFTRDIIVPKNYKLKIVGANVYMAEGVSLISYSPLIIINSSFTGLNNDTWGVVAVVGAYDKESRVVGGYFDGGSDELLNGIYFSGMLSAYHSDLTVDSSQFKNAAADDGLNVKSARAIIERSKFIENSADGIDLDFVKKSKVAENQFKNNGNDAIDISGANVLIENNLIEGSDDKCISVGEKSLDTVIFNNVLSGCHIGVEIKDLSDIYIINNFIGGNEIGVNAYRKKEVFGGGMARVYNTIFSENKIDKQVDDYSQIDIGYSRTDATGEGNFIDQPDYLADFTINPETDKIKFINGGNVDVLQDVLGIDLDEAPVGLYNKL